MKVLGLGGSDHDVASCIVEQGKIMVAIEDERISRCKYAIGSNLLYGLSRKYCYDALGINLKDIDQVVIDDILAETAYFGIRKYKKINHHLAHAASSYYPSPFDEAALLVIDNAGSLIDKNGVKGVETISYGIGHGKNIDLFQTNVGVNYHEARIGKENKVYQRGDSDDSVGHFYKVISGCIGFKFFDHNGFFYPEAGKTMGLAPYGDSRYYNQIAQFVSLENEGKVKIELTNGRLKKLVEDILEQEGQKEKEFLCKASIAWACQKLCEESVLHCANYLYEKTKIKNLCYSGGVALNCVINGKILEKTPFEQIFLFPACGDNGTAVGCAYHGYYEEKIKKEKYSYIPPSFGKEYPKEEIEKVLKKYELQWKVCDNVAKCAAQSIANGEIIAWYQGGAEFGPRALGHRSILADPRNENIKDILNTKVKFREGFRPFAPAILKEKVAEFFEDELDSPYMLMASTVKKEKRELVPGIVHIDGTARLQTVSGESKFYSLLKYFDEITGIPMVVNTSFNVKGEPICETPKDAIECFQKTELDVLYLENYEIKKHTRINSFK